MKNVLEYLEGSAKDNPYKLAFADLQKKISYENLVTKSKGIGTALSGMDCRNKPIAIFMEKSVDNLPAMMGVVYSGNFYTIVDSRMPIERVRSIFNTLKPVAVVTDSQNQQLVKSMDYSGKIFTYDFLENCPADEDKLSKIRRLMIDTDPLYCLFTSGSTGIPKGTIINHRNAISYVEWVTETFDINKETVFGNQTPFYFSMSVLDIYSTIKNGAAMHIIPKQYFSFPINLINFMNDRKINTIYWVPSALCIVANLKLFNYVKPLFLKKVLFAGEVMPTKQLNYWISNLPDLMYANLFGPTEVTDICTYYVVNRSFKDDEALPIGIPCNNCDVMVVKADGTLAGTGEEGELYVRGSFISSGYYNNQGKTSEVFVQNPFNENYPEIVYKTGDLAKLNEHGELVYLCRKDSQIKHMGYRIELGEIEAAAGALEGVVSCVCIYDAQSEQIVLVYQGLGVSKTVMLEWLKKHVPDYMMPEAVINIDAMPYNTNGKIDRLWIKNNYKKINGGI